MPDIRLHSDAFSSGQISSKLWLCEEIERIKFNEPQTIWIYGGWYGTLSLLLFVRNRLSINHIRSFDIDPDATQNADLLLENWVWQKWKFKAITADCNNLNFDAEKPSLIINCSSEHFDTLQWFDNIPANTYVAIQSNNMTHDTHVSCVESLDKFVSIYKDSLEITYTGSLEFNYPNWSFTRYMLIGRKL